MFPIIYLNEVLSTNVELKRLSSIEDLDEGLTISAYSQTAGKGQSGSPWESEPGKNLTFSTILYPDFLPVKKSFLLSQVISLSIKDVLDGIIPDVTIKWPNDIYFRDKKISGILIENEIEGSVLKSSVIGVGLNVNQEHFISEAPNPVSLKQITGKDTDLDELLKKILIYLDIRYSQLKNKREESIISDYTLSLYRKNGYHTYVDADGSFEGIIENVAEDGLLTLRKKNGELKSYYFKEVSFFY